MNGISKTLLLASIAAAIFGMSYVSATISDDKVYTAYPESKQEGLLKELEDA